VGLVSWLDPHMIPIVALLCVGISATHLTNIRRLVAGKEGGVVRPVRWNRRPKSLPAEVLEQSPAGEAGGPEAWPADELRDGS